MIKTTTKLKKCFAVLRARREVFNRRGQVAVFYALLIPIFLFVGGVGLDLGWYYLSVSRLQNAADASVLVGAKTLTKTHDLFKGKSYKVQLVDKFPAGSPAYDTADNSKKNTSGKLIDTTIGDEAALDYAKKNLADNSLGYAPPSLFSVAQAANDDSIKDGYTRGDNTVTMKTGLYQDGEDYFYVIGLNENIHHFFIGFLKDMNAGVVSVALISQSITDDPGGGNGGGEEPPNKELTFDGNGGTFSKGITTSKETVASPDSMGEDDTITLVPDDGLPSREGYTFEGWSTDKTGNGKHYDNNQKLTSEELKELLKGGGRLYAVWKEVDPYTPEEPPPPPPPIEPTLKEGKIIDLKQNKESGEDRDYSDDSKGYKRETFDIGNLSDDVCISFSPDAVNLRGEEWDPTFNTKRTRQGQYVNDPANHAYRNPYGSKVYPSNEDKNGDPFRVHGIININATATGKPNAPLYVVIKPEYSNLTEEYKPKIKADGNYTSVRQIVININRAPSERPLIFIYDKPMVSNPDSNESLTINGKAGKMRDPLPIIINLNYDFKGGIYAPNAPVFINGNSHNFDGFIVAKEFVDTQDWKKAFKNTGEPTEPYAEFNATGKLDELCPEHGRNNEKGRHRNRVPIDDQQLKMNGKTVGDNHGSVLYKTDGKGNYLRVQINSIETEYNLGTVTPNNFGLAQLNLHNLADDFGADNTFITNPISLPVPINGQSTSAFKTTT